MKSRISLLHCILLGIWLQSTLVNSLSCTTPFTELPYASGTYCAKCDVTCSTCSGTSINSCSSCPTDFSLNSTTSTCMPPSSTTIKTVMSVYHTFGFQKETGWTGGDAAVYSSCGIVSVLRGTLTDVISVTHTLDIHYKVRIMVSIWWFSSTNGAITVQLASSAGANLGSGTASPTGTAGTIAGASLNPYCANSQATNYQLTITESSTANVKVNFKSVSNTDDWGLRQYVLIEYLCSQPDCKTCYGSLSTQCYTCNDAHKKMYASPYGPCLCKYQDGYYAYPTGNSTYYCVNKCPNFLSSGQYYGDNTTKTCVTTCPVFAGANQWGISFASDQYGICVKTCDPKMTLGGISVDVYYDVTNRKCTTKCPSSEPYSWQIDRACYSDCPSVNGTQYYKLDTDMTCVDVCPNITQGSRVAIPLYIDNTTNSCVTECDDSIGYWGYLDPVSGVRECVFNCPHGYFRDSTTGRPLCTKVCPGPDWFGDFKTLPPACVQTCSFGTYGDQTSADRYCVTKCNGTYYGLRTGDRTCISVCPVGTWGEPTTMSCATAAFQCMSLSTNPFTGTQTVAGCEFDISVFAFADSHLRKCIYANVFCSVGQFKHNATYLCITTCPAGTYANNITYWCVDTCYGDYFADNVTNKCVKVCSPGYYADRGSIYGNKCVKNCNQTGGYPFRDDHIRQCVSICTAGYADQLAESCVFNCTPPLYLNNSISTELTCVGHCTAPYFAYNNSDSGICILICPEQPPFFGDIVNTHRVCVEVCQIGTFGDQTDGSLRECVPHCPNGTFAQNDTLRRCVKRCSDDTYGRVTDWTCVDALDCPPNFTGDPRTNMCVDQCPPSAGTFADNISKLCVQKCPIDNGTYYYADSHTRWCITTCDSTYSQFGNNSTQTCQTSCLDRNSFADAQSNNRFCIDVCTWVGVVKYYRNNQTSTCVLSTGCLGTYYFSSTSTYTEYYFADNHTLYCVQKCPNVSGTPTWGYVPTQTCVELCFGDTWGDNSTGIPLCVSKCSSYPKPLWSYDGPGNKTVNLCVSTCPSPYFGEDYGRTCVLDCPLNTTDHLQTYAYDGTRRCLLQCPDGTWADYLTGVCFHHPINCTDPCWYTNSSCSSYRWASDYNNSCVYLCNSSPFNEFGDNLTQKCTGRCSLLSYADNQTGTRICVERCPGEYDANGDTNGTYDSYGDNNTQSCVRHCQQPDTYADWQLNLCLYRCMGDDPMWVSTFANIFTMRCVISLYCPVYPDLYYGQNVTRQCQPACILNSTYVSFADNITRMCISQCYNYTNGTNSSIDTTFYGDVSTERPVCVIACPEVPRLFGQNFTNLCVEECPDYQFGDQTGNRSCVDLCPNINGVTWFSQLTERICVLVCEEGTWGNYYNSLGPHCETVGTDCNDTQFGDNSTHMCVPICPASMNYFGEPSTRLCTDYCPFLNASQYTLFNATAGINLTQGRLFADQKTRLCVYTCPEDYGQQGTFGDNSTNTCVEMCPSGSFGDANTDNRFCVETCTGGSFADNLTTRCVDTCPASPPTFGYAGNWTCLKSCPANLWADSQTRLCSSNCTSGFRLTLTVNTCVSVCPSYPDLYGDPTNGNCVSVCNGSQVADPSDRLCKGNCNPLFQYDNRCVKYCPEGYYADANYDCVVPTSCDNNTYADNSTTQCVGTCPSGSYADPVSKYCIAVCPQNYYGDNLKCVQTCQTNGTIASNITQLCEGICTNYTYAFSGQCYENCSGNRYENDQTHLCDTSCPSGQFGDPTTNRCVKYCPTGYYRKLTGADNGLCVDQNGGCSGLFADFVTGNCVQKCSTGYWGYDGNYTCNVICPAGLYGYESPTQRTCYAPNFLPGSPMLFADQQSGEFVAVCPQTPVLTYGDRNRQLCVSVCLPVSNVTYYGDPESRQCQLGCQNPTHYTADPATSLCTLRCSYGTFRYNNTPICVTNCPLGYGDFTSRICVATCGQLTNTFGYHNTSSGYRVCLTVCPDTYYSEPQTRTCTKHCPNITISYYAYNATRQCMPYCNDSYADDSNSICVKQCLSFAYPNADNSTNRCVYECPSKPDFYADNHVCVYYCTTSGYFADTNGRKCVSRCSNISGTTGHVQYGDPRTGRCEQNCSLYTWGDNSTNLCVVQCPPESFADNTTGKCVAQCPKSQGIYADMLLHVCAPTCSGGYFGSQVNQTCIKVCDDGYYGDPTTTLCTLLCPVKIYSYGQNVTRTCVKSCVGWVGGNGTIGYADNYSRLCRDECQNTLFVQTFADPTTQACVQICPQGYYAQNDTNTCTKKCANGTFADNFSVYCVQQCPNNPQSYGDTLLNMCLYSCLRGEFSDNTTNLCVPVCPSLNNSQVDYYGDSHTGRCAKWCTEGTYADSDSRRCVGTCPDGTFADNLTRTCVLDCPPQQFTFADSTTHRCVRICPLGYYAQNTTQACQLACWNYTLTHQSYADNISRFCVEKCPQGYFGDNSSHSCVINCSTTRDQYGHFIGRVCVSRLDCYPDNSTGEIYYADSISRTCVQKCPLTLWADTHIFVCLPDCDSSLPEFRNTHNQMCERPCPSDPDQYGDTSSGNCLRTCPPHSYAWTGNRTCQSSCAQFNLYADNSTNRCVSQCNTLPYYYADPLKWQCVYHCSSSYFADNRTQTCVDECPAQWALFGEKHNYTCVSICPPNEFADVNDGRVCNEQCTNNYFADNFTSSCVAHCRDVRPFWFEDTSKGTGVCVDQCPDQSYGYLPDQTCKYSNLAGNLSDCPDNYYADRKSKLCVTFCPNGTYSFILTKYCENSCSDTYYADPILRKCVETCSSNLFKFQKDINTNLCVQFCPAPLYALNSSNGNDSACVDSCQGMLALTMTRTCQTYCPSPYFGDWTSNQCVVNCTPKYSYMPNRTCLQTCDQPYYGNPLTFTCDLLCPQYYFGENSTRMCTQKCPNSSYADPSIRICVADCPSHPSLYADDRSNQCLEGCLAPLFADDTTRSCVDNCTNVTVGSLELRYLADPFVRRCVLQCNNELISFADYDSNICTKKCPPPYFANNDTKECVLVCPNVPNDTYSDNTSRICMKQCTNGFGYQTTLNCVAACWWPYFADPVTRTCVQYCPDLHFGDNYTATCTKTCPPNSYADPVTHRCLIQCPALHLYFNYAGNWTCLLNCPSGFYANTDLQSCVSICNSSSGMFSYGPTNLCVRQCPIPYRGYPPNNTCVLKCPSIGYYYDVTINQCNICDEKCFICISNSTCQQCMPGYNLFNGVCDLSCVPTDIITYASGGQCVTVCPPGSFGNNVSYACTGTCPPQQYGDPATHLCTLCPSTCSACTSSVNCQVCQIGATLAIDNMCYSNCNSTYKYSYDGKCWNTCPNGTYLTYTNVICAACASICSTCFSSSTNCTSCISSYYYDNNCLTTCPPDFYGNATTLQCMSCSNFPEACARPLNFSTTYTVENYKSVITLQFNQNISLRQSLQKILKIRLVVNRLLQIGTLVNDGITYTYQILSNGTIKIYLDIGTSLIQPTFAIDITDPSAVISADTGMSLQTVQSLLTIAKIDYYPADQGEEAGTNFVSTFTVVIFLLLYLLTFFFSDVLIRPLQFLQLIFLHCLIDSPVPANIYYLLVNLRSSTLHFITNWFTSSFPSSSAYYDTPLKIQDTCTDYLFLRNVGQIFVIVVVAICFWFVFLLLGNKKVVSHKVWHSFFNEVSEKRFKFMLINDILSFFYLPITYFGFWQFKHLFDGTGIYAFNGISTLIFVLTAIIVPIVWLTLWCKRTPEDVHNSLWFLSLRVKTVSGESVPTPIYDDKSEQKLKQSSQGNGPPGSQIQQNPYQTETLVFYLYLLLCSIWMVGLYTMVYAQLVLLIITNCLFLVYLLKVRPYLNKINLLFSILFVLSQITLEAFYIYFFKNDQFIYASEKTATAFPFVVALCVVLILLILWALWRVVWQVSFFVKKFKATLLYLQFADHDYVGQQEQTQKYSQYDKLAQKLQTGLGDTLVQKIQEALNEEGSKVIKVTKKRLVKKQKTKGRKKGEPLPQQQSNMEFVRVNQVNIFDYAHQLDEPIKKQPQETEIIHKKHIDDDARDIISDEQQQIPVGKYRDEEQEKKIDVQPGQELMKNIDELSSIEKGASSEKESEYPFADVDSKKSEEEKKNNEYQLPSNSNQGYEFEEPAEAKSPEHKKEQHHDSYQEMKSSSVFEESRQLQKKQEKIFLPQIEKESPPVLNIELDEPQSSLKQEKHEETSNLPGKEQKKMISLQDLIAEEDSKKKKNLLYLFDDFEED